MVEGKNEKKWQQGHLSIQQTKETRRVDPPLVSSSRWEVEPRVDQFGTSQTPLSICPTLRKLVRTMLDPSSRIVRNKLETVPWLKREHVTHATSSICVIAPLHERETFCLWTCASIFRRRFPIDLLWSVKPTESPTQGAVTRGSTLARCLLPSDIWQVFLFGDQFASWYNI